MQLSHGQELDTTKNVRVQVTFLKKLKFSGNISICLLKKLNVHNLFLSKAGQTQVYHPASLDNEKRRKQAICCNNGSVDTDQG